MGSGYHGKILHVDLTTGKSQIENPTEQFYRIYPGGGALGAYYLLKDGAYKVDALSPGNTLVFAPSVVSGAPVSGLSRFTVTARSPLTGAIGDTQAGGNWAVALKRCGVDALVIRGKAPSPVYLLIRDGNVTIKDAANLWGRKVSEAEAMMLEETKNTAAAAALIGPGGENLVRYAAIVNGGNHFNGRTGMGAVMGSKNLKGVVLSPSLKLEFADPGKLIELAKTGAERARMSDGAQFLRNLGTSGATMLQNSAGCLPTRNFERGDLPLLDEGFEEALNNARGKSETCYGCIVRCKKKLAGGYTAYGGLPEYETLAALGAYTGVSDFESLLKANELCTEYTLDTISTGGTIALAMECFEKGIIPGEDLDGLELKFGNGEAMLEIIEAIAFRRGIGSVLAEGSVRAAASWGSEAEKLAVAVKGLEVPAHLPQVKHALALAYALNPFGADHVSSEHDAIFASENESDREIMYGLGLYETRPAFVLDSEKVRFFAQSHHYYSILDTYNLCAFCFGLGWLYGAGDMVDIVNAATGWKTTFLELMLTGERRINMQRVFNLRAGISSDADTLPEKIFHPLKGGPSDGAYIDRDVLAALTREYYALAGWDTETGYPKGAKLKELSLGWLMEDE